MDARGERLDRAGLRRAVHPDHARGAAPRLPVHAESRTDVLRRSVKRVAVGPRAAPNPGPPPGRARRPVAACACLLAALAVVAMPRRAQRRRRSRSRLVHDRDDALHVHFDKHLEPVARRIATLVEGIHDRQGEALGYVPKDFTEITLNDDTDEANGSATAIPFNNIRLFVTAPDDLSVLGDYDDWYPELVTHEYTHIVHTDNISGLPAVVNAVLGKSYAPNQVQPRWILEGLAVVRSRRTRARGGFARTSSTCSCAPTCSTIAIAGIDQFSSNPYRWPQGNLWYLYGSRFLQWIFDVYGPNTMRAVSPTTARRRSRGGSTARSAGRPGARTSSSTRASRTTSSASTPSRCARSVKRGLREGTRLTCHGRNVFYPRFVPKAPRRDADAEEILYYRDDSDTRAGPLPLPPRRPKREGDDEELVARADGEPGARASRPRAISSSTASRPLQELLLPQRSLLSPARRESRRRATRAAPPAHVRAARALIADVSPDGKRSSSRSTPGDVLPRDRRPRRRSGTVERQARSRPQRALGSGVHAALLARRRRVAYSSWTAGGFRDIRVVDVATGTLLRVTHDRALDMTPVWSPDGKTLYFAPTGAASSTSTPTTSAARCFAQVTNVRTGAFMPAVSDDGKTLVYVGYSTYGHDLYDDAARSGALPARGRRSSTSGPTRRTEPDDVPLRRHSYNPLPDARAAQLPSQRSRPATTAPTRSPSPRARRRRRWHPHISRRACDRTERARRRTSSLDYCTAGCRSTSACTSSTGRAAQRLRGQRPDGHLQRDDNAASPRASRYTHQEASRRTPSGCRSAVANFKGDLPGRAVLDPYSRAPGRRRRSGNINVVHVGYGYSNVEGEPRRVRRRCAASRSTSAPTTRRTTPARATRPTTISGGFTGYVPMPWPGHQTLALRTAGAVSGGDYPRGGAYYVGGYDLANNSLPVTVLSGVFNGVVRAARLPAGRLLRARSTCSATSSTASRSGYADHGISTLPLYLRRLDGNVFVDYGGAFDYLDLHAHPLLPRRRAHRHPQLHASVGAELWFGLTLGYVARYAAPPRLRLRLQRRGGQGRAAVLHRLQRVLTKTWPGARCRLSPGDGPKVSRSLWDSRSSLAELLRAAVPRQRLTDNAIEMNTAMRL